MSKPIRIQLRRTKGWRMPPNTVKVDRTTKWGNPFKVGQGASPKICVERFREWVLSNLWTFPNKWEIHEQLRGKNLACWCPLIDKDGKLVPCHADVLLKIANP